MNAKTTRKNNESKKHLPKIVQEPLGFPGPKRAQQTRLPHLPSLRQWSRGHNNHPPHSILTGQRERESARE